MKTNNEVLAKWRPVIKKCLEVPTASEYRFAMLLEAASKMFDTVELTRYVIPAFRKLFSNPQDDDYETDNLSVGMQAFVDGICGSKNYPGMIRKSLLDNVMTSIPRPTDPTQLISDQARLKDKLHDREPGLVIEEVEKRCPTFFDELPRREDKPPTLDQKRQFLCNYIRHFYHQGKRKYQKPNLRKDRVNEVTVVQ